MAKVTKKTDKINNMWIGVQFWVHLPGCITSWELIHKITISFWERIWHLCATNIVLSKGSFWDNFGRVKGLPGTQLGDEMPYCELKLNLIAKLSILGEFSWFVVSIDKTIRGNSYLKLELVLQDFQENYVTLFKTDFGTL